MPIRKKQGGVRDRVLEGRHVIGLFVIILLFSGLFFALGFVMGRSQYDGKVLADRLPRNGVLDAFDSPKPLPGRHGNGNVDGASSAKPAAIPAPDTANKNPAWDTHDFDSGVKRPNDRLEPQISPAGSSQKSSPAVVKNTSATMNAHGKPASAPPLPSGAFTLQVAALKSEADAMDLAKTLQNKKFPAFVASPQNDKFYRVQVGPYNDQKAVDSAKKGLDAAGFKAIVKH